MRSPSHDSFTLAREYSSNPERVFGAFSDPIVKRRWFAEGEGFMVDSYELDFRVNGSEKCAFRVDTPEFRSDEIGNQTFYLDIVPNQRIMSAYSMSNSGVPFSASLQTITLEPTPGGTRLTLVEQVTFFEGADGLELRKQGTLELLESLARELQASAVP